MINLQIWPLDVLPPRKRKQRGPDELQRASKHYLSLSTFQKKKEKQQQINRSDEMNNKDINHHHTTCEENVQASLEMSPSPTFSQSLTALCHRARSGPEEVWHGLCSPAGTPAASPNTCTNSHHITSHHITVHTQSTHLKLLFLHY